MFFSETSVTIYSTTLKKQVKVIEDFFCKAIICFKEGLCYALFREADKSTSHGLKQLDIDSLERF